jgi:hypothetical protein
MYFMGIFQEIDHLIGGGSYEGMILKEYGNMEGY